MDIKQYQKETQRTANPELSKNERIDNAIYGIMGEFGEVVDILKKHKYQAHSLDFEHLVEELGDTLYYFCDLLEQFDLDIEQIAELNNMKLRKRFPDGFDKERSMNRK